MQTSLPELQNGNIKAFPFINADKKKKSFAEYGESL